jgi:hypothetical protein
LGLQEKPLVSGHDGGGPVGIISLLEAPSKIPSLLPFPIGLGEIAIPLGLGGDYASGVVSFLKAPFWVNETVFWLVQFVWR